MKSSARILRYLPGSILCSHSLVFSTKNTNVFILHLYYKCMAMTVAQVRLPEGLMDEVEKLVTKGFYTNKSDVIRDALRKLILEKQAGSVQNTGDSVKEIREIRKRLSKGFTLKDLNEINALG